MKKKPDEAKLKMKKPHTSFFKYLNEQIKFNFKMNLIS